jgi:hypothetical protein
MEKAYPLQHKDWKGKLVEDFNLEEHVYSFTEMIRCLVLWPLSWVLAILLTLFNVLIFDLAQLRFMTQVMIETLNPWSTRVIKEE